MQLDMRIGKPAPRTDTLEAESVFARLGGGKGEAPVDAGLLTDYPVVIVKRLLHTKRQPEGDCALGGALYVDGDFDA
jgi:hypothetical protein